MASNQDQYNEKNAELIAAFEDLIKKAKSLIKLNDQNVGAAAGADSLDQIAVGSQSTVRAALDFDNAVKSFLQGYGVARVGAPRLLDIGAQGIEAGLYSFNSSVGSTGELPSFSAGSILYGYSAESAATYPTELAIDRVGRGLEFRASNGSNGWGSWTRVWTSKNTTVDSNGFIKSASPIFRLANAAESADGDGFTLDGCGAYNSEAEGVTASHDDLGVYTVSGSQGFADDGWTIEIPQDVNGNRLCFVETETADDGTITVRTFGRRFDFDTAMIVAGDPIDIPDGRWIDLRLKVP